MGLSRMPRGGKAASYALLSLETLTAEGLPPLMISRFDYPPSCFYLVRKLLCLTWAVRETFFYTRGGVRQTQESTYLQGHCFLTASKLMGLASPSARLHMGSSSSSPGFFPYSTPKGTVTLLSPLVSASCQVEYGVRWRRWYRSTRIENTVGLRRRLPDTLRKSYK